MSDKAIGDTGRVEHSKTYGLRYLVLACCLLGACAAPAIKPSESHIQAEAEKPTSAPSPVTQSVVLPPPKPAANLETYSVVVTGVPVQELLFALARDAKLNVDIHSGIQGTVTLNAINQTLPQILSRIAKQVDMRYEVDGPNLVVMPDTPFLRNYTIDYVNMARDATSNVAIATQITTPGATGTGGTGGATAGGGNTSVTSITNTTKNRFWETLIQNIKDLLKETDKILPEGTSETVVQQAETQATTGAGGQPPVRAGAPAPAGIAGSPGPAVLETAGTTVVRRTTFREAASVIANPEAGIIMVRASSRQHEKVQEFLDSIMTNARRQVLIEATIVEVALNQNYQQGIDWQYIRQQGSQSAIGQGATTQRFDPVTGALTAVASTLPSAVANTLFTAAFRNGGFTAAIKLLEAFGTTKVVSSPKLSVLNNQTAVLKVVDNLVYFTIKADTTTNQTTAVTTFTTTPNTVSVGFVMSVTPQIGDDDSVLLNVRPTISRPIGLGKQDPNPSLAGIPSLIPEIQTREMESLLRINSGEIAVMGGLMQDEVSNRDDGVPGLADVPLLGNLFTHRNDTTRKTELVIFVRPIVIKEASLDGDYKSFRPLLPGSGFTSVPNPFSKRPAWTSQ